MGSKVVPGYFMNADGEVGGTNQLNLKFDTSVELLPRREPLAPNE